MADISTWSTTPGNNNSASPDGWKENMAPSEVNNTARQQMADLKTWYNRLEWSYKYTATYSSATAFTSDTTVTNDAGEYIFEVNRRVRIYRGTTGDYLYGTITALGTRGSSGTVDVTIDDGTSLTDEALTVYVSIISVQNSAIPWPYTDIRDCGAIGDGTTDNKTALTNALAIGLPIYIPDGSYYVASKISHTGKVVIFGTGAIVSDATWLEVTSGDDSEVSGISHDILTTPWLVTRWDANDAWQTAVMTNSKTAKGYQYTVNDTDITPAAGEQTDYWTGINFITSDRVHVHDTHGDFVVYRFLDCNYCKAYDNNFRGGRSRGSIYFGTVNGAVDVPNYGNEAYSNTIRYASFSSICFYNSRDYKAFNNTLAYCGESHVKTYQNDGDNPYAPCKRGEITNNKLIAPFYGGVDCAQNYPHTGAGECHNTVSHNRAYYSNRNGFYLEGTHLTAVDNRAYKCTLSGFLADASDSTFSGNRCVDCNTSNTDSGQNNFAVSGDRNEIHHNKGMFTGSAQNGYNIYVNGNDNSILGNDARDQNNGGFFVNDATAIVAGNCFGKFVDATNTANFEHYAPSTTANDVDVDFRVRSNMTNPVGRLRAHLDVATAGSENGKLKMQSVYGGQLRDAVVANYGNSSNASVQLAAPAMALVISDLMAGSVGFSIDETGNNLLIHVRYNGTTTFKTATVALP